MKNLFDIFKKPKLLKDTSSFKKGDVYKMKVASRSHVKKPYYVIIEVVNDDAIVTTIPGFHSLCIQLNSPEWEYHIPRMKLVGNSEEDKKLLYNQKHLIPKI